LVLVVRDAGSFVDGGGLHSRDLMLAQGLAHNVQAAGERRIAEGPLGSASLLRPDGPDQRLFWIDELGLGFGQSLVRCMTSLRLMEVKDDCA
jgi:hypothetical protein